MSLKKASKVKTEFSMASMTDIIFLLLIFFLITSTFTQENVLKVLLPKGQKSVQVTAKRSTISLSVSGIYGIDGKKMSKDRLPEVILGILSKNPNTVFSIHADKRVQYEKVIELVNVCDQVGAKAVLALQKMK